MDCEWTERVSLMIDDQLGPDETIAVKEHITSCALCAGAIDDFLRVREEISAYTSTVNLESIRRELDGRMRRGHVAWWQRTVTVPLPVAAALLFVLFSAVAFLAAMRFGKPAPQPTASRALPPDRQQDSPMSLSAYDHGGRPVMYKVKRAQTSLAR